MDESTRIRDSVEVGLSIAEIQAGVLRREMTADELAVYHAARADFKMREAQRKAERQIQAKSKARMMRALREKEDSIDDVLNAARLKINWKRRRKAEKSLAAWVKAYGIGVFVDDEPPPHGDEILAEMEAAIRASSRPYQILMSRGHGKTSYAESAVAWAISTGIRRFGFIISQGGEPAKDIFADIMRLFSSTNFANDYPDISVPIMMKRGVSKRRQLYRGKETELSWNSKRIWLPVIDGADGKPSQTSGSVIMSGGITSGVRGKKRGTLRPDLVLLDDLQTAETADNPETVGKLANLIRKDVMNLGGKGKMATMMTATVIEPDDLAETFAADKAWKTTRFRAIISWPTDFEKDPDKGLWGQYFDIFDAENARDEPHAKSLKFYRTHRRAMDAGSEVLNPKRFKREDGHISALHALMDKLHEIGRAAFDAEYQMSPHRSESVVAISAPLIMSRVRRGTAAGFIPNGTVFVSAATDINPSYAITTSIVAFDIQRTAFVTHYHTTRCHIPDNLNDTVFDQRVFDALAAHARGIVAQGVKLDAWGIDAGGKQFKTVTRFVASEAGMVCGVKPTAMLGRAGVNWNPNVRSRIRAATNETVLCADTEHRRWMAWNADSYKESMHKAWGAEVESPGGLSLFDGNANHIKFAAQVANEVLKKKTPIKGDRFDYKWKTKEPHDYGDTLAMNYALAGANGITGAENFRKGSRKVKVGHAGAKSRSVAPTNEPKPKTETASAPAAATTPAPAETHQPVRKKTKIGHA